MATLTNDAFAAVLLGIVADYHNGVTTQAEAVEALKAELPKWAKGGAAVAVSAALASEAITSLNRYLQQGVDWYAGTATGGPNNDGYYPVTDTAGNDYLLPSPAKLIADLAGVAPQGALDDVADLPAAGNAVGDYYTHPDPNDAEAPRRASGWTGAAWVDLGAWQGETGAGGVDGASILTGAGAPGAGDGVDGDSYIDTTTGDVYGPKAGGAWGAATGNIKGPQGDAGADGVDGDDGASILSGAGAPGAGDGIDGDSYIDTTTGDVYGPKAGGAWGAATGNIKGPQGDAGADGVDGASILTGAGAPDAGDGVDGDSYIDTTTGDVYGPKAGGAWSAATGNIKGDKGDTGEPFSWDAQGSFAARSTYDGEAEGFAYLALDGDGGSGGPAVLYLKSSGASGDWSGAVPFQGLQGNDGASILSGAGAPGTGDGIDGDSYIDTTTGNVYGPKAGGAWGAATGNIKGPEGPQGLKGDPGPGLPAGGTAGQILVKASGTDYETGWADPPTGGGMQVAEIQTAAFTPKIGMAYPVSTAGGPVTLSALPTGAEQGDRFELHDSGRSWGETNKVIVPGDPYDTWLTNVGGVVMFEHDGTGWQIYIQSGDDPADYLEQHVARPSIISPVNGATDVGESPTIESSVFAVVNGVDTQIAAGWKITSDAAGETVVVQSLADAVNLTSWTVPIGNLTPSTGFYVWVMHTGATYGDSAWSLAGSFTTAAVFMDPDAQVIINAMSSTPSGARQSLIEDLVAGLKADGIWAKLDALWVLAAHDSQAAALNWMDPAGSPILPVNAPVFTADRGFKGDNTSTHLDTQFVPGTDAVNFVQDSASAGIWVREVASDNGDIYLGTGDNSSSSTFTRIQRRSDGVEWRVWGPNGGLLDGGTDSEVATGLLVADRSGATAFHTYRNGALENTGSAGSGSPSPYSVYLLAANGSGAAGSQSDAQLSAAFLGGSLTGTEHANLHTRLNTYLTAVGAV